MEYVLLLLTKGAFWAIGLFGGATMLENTLENYIMEHCPQWAKGLVVPVISLVFAIVANMQGGLSWQEALTAALTIAASTTLIHNHPDLTTRDLPAAPATAEGLPEFKDLK